MRLTDIWMKMTRRTPPKVTVMDLYKMWMPIAAEA